MSTEATIGVGIGLLGIAISVIVYWLQRVPKRLEWIGLGRPVLTRGRPEDLQVLFKDDVVQEPELLLLRFANTGKREVRGGSFDQGGDYEEPIEVILNENTRVLSASVTSRLPENLKAEVEFRDNNIVVRPGLLNPGDWFEVNALVDGTLRETPPKVTTRIAGVHDVLRRARRPQRAFLITASLAVFSTFALGFYVADWATGDWVVHEDVDGGSYLALERSPLNWLPVSGAILLGGLWFFLVLWGLSIRRGDKWRNFYGSQ